MKGEATHFIEQYRWSMQKPTEFRFTPCPNVIRDLQYHTDATKSNAGITVAIFRIRLKVKCYDCSGTGLVRLSTDYERTQFPTVNCRNCNGTGKY